MPDKKAHSTALRVLVVDESPDVRFSLAAIFEADGHHVVAHGNVHDALADASWQAFDLAFLDLQFATTTGEGFIKRLRAETPWCKVVVITPYASVDTAVDAIKAGASDYLPKPFSPTQVQMVTSKVAERRQLERQIEAMRDILGDMDPESDFTTSASAMRRAIDLAKQMASTHATVLIRGEVGTGKGRLARAIHAWSNRAAGPFALASCQTTSVDLLEAELFGLSQKSNGDSIKDPIGRVEFCDGGTLVLDEIGEAPLSLQPKLLRLLRDKEFERHDDYKPRQSNARIIATTSIDLHSAVKRGRFRADLLECLEIARIDLPPLRQRSEDIEQLATRYLNYFAKQSHRKIAGFTQDASDAIAKHAWPGNIRELRNVIERAVLLCKDELVDLQHLPPNLLNTPVAYAVGDLVAMETIEDLHIRKVVASTRSIAKAASVLGINRTTIVRRLKQSERTPPESLPDSEIDVRPAM